MPRRGTVIAIRHRDVGGLVDAPEPVLGQSAPGRVLAVLLEAVRRVRVAAAAALAFLAAFGGREDVGHHAAQQGRHARHARTYDAHVELDNRPEAERLVVQGRVCRVAPEGDCPHAKYAAGGLAR